MECTRGMVVANRAVRPQAIRAEGGVEHFSYEFGLDGLGWTWKTWYSGEFDGLPRLFYIMEMEV
jgi:hypothetical protein